MAVLLSIDMGQRSVVARFFDGRDASAKCSQACAEERVSRPCLLHVAVGPDRFPEEENGGRRTVICAG